MDRILWTLLFSALALASACSSDDKAFDSAALHTDNTGDYSLAVAMVKPEGVEQSDVNQVVIIFNKKMVPLGDMEKSAQDLPVSISPDLNCHWRWLNTTTLACWLDEILLGSTEYTVRVGAGITALDGTQLSTDYNSVFATQTIKLVRQEVEFIGPVNPVVIIALNQPAEIESLKDAASFKCEGSRVTGAADVRHLSADEEKGIWDAYRSYRFEPTADLHAGSKCNLSLADGVHSTEGSLPSTEAVNVSFSTFPEFYVSELRCGWRNKTAGEVSSDRLSLKDCDPNTAVSIGFSTPVFTAQLAGKLSISPQAGWKPGGYNSPEYMRDNPDEILHSYYLNRPFDGTTEYRVVLNDELTDRFGRRLRGAHQLGFTTGHYEPFLSVTRNTAVIEKQGPHKLGFSAVNVKRFRLRLFSGNDLEKLSYIPAVRNRWSCDKYPPDPRNLYDNRIVELDQPWDHSMVMPLDFEELLPDHDHGYVLGLIDEVFDLDGNRIDVWGSDRKPLCPQMFVVQITDLGITSKLGYFNGGAWVHSLGGGSPRADVEVLLINGDGETAFRARTDRTGFVELPGLKTLDPNREMTHWNADNWYLVARTDSDMSFLIPDDWGNGIASYQFNIGSTRLSKKNNFLVQSIADRPLYKPGDEVRIKLFARQWDHEALKLIDPDERQVFVEVSNRRGDKVFERTAVTLNEFSTGQFSFELPKTAATGPYLLHVTNSYDYTLAKSDVFRIEEYRVPDFKVRIGSDRGDFDLAETVPVSGRVEYHFGGSVSNASGRLSASFRSGTFRSVAPELTDYSYGIVPTRENWWDMHGENNQLTRFLQKEIATDEQGDFVDLISLPTSVIDRYSHLIVEAGFDDDNGKAIANRFSVEIHPTDFYIGLKFSEWVYEPGEDLGIDVIALSPEEEILAGHQVKLTLLRRNFNTVRRRGTGNFFRYETVTEDEPVMECELTTRASARSCSLVPESAGFYIVRAEATDTRGREVVSVMSTYVTGLEYIGWWRNDHDRIDLIPEQAAYELGDTLRVLVKSPYTSARALITIERHGILHREERDLEGGAQVLEFPLDSKTYAPGVYLSVVLIQGRVGETIENGVDLGRPSFKMGMIKVPVNNPDTRLTVATATDKSEYKPGDRVTAELSVHDIRGDGVESEVAVAVVDEALLQLVADYQKKYEVHDGFYHMPYLDVMTSETLIHLLGRRHFGKKGADAGGGGGAGEIALREAFKAVAHWEPALMTGADGKTSFSFSAPDNLTSWRIIAVAVDRNHRFGNGGSAFKVNKELMLVSALPNFATEGDEFDARFVLHNRSSSDLDVNVELGVDGLDFLGREELDVDVERGGKTVVQFPVKAQSVDEATIEIRARSSADSDGMRLQLPIAKFVSFETFATYGSTVTDRVQEQVAIPQGIRTDVGGLELRLSSSVLSHLDDTFRYVFDYPYQCWEQRLTRALMYRNNVELTDYLGEEIRQSPDEAREIIDSVLGDAALFQAPNGGFVYWKARDELASPYLSAYTALSMHWLTQSGYAVDRNTTKKLNGYLRGLLENDGQWPWWYTKRSRATVRAMIAYVLGKQGDDLSGQLSNLFNERELLSLFGKGFLAMALHQNGDAMASQQQSLMQEIMNRSEITSGKVVFSESHDDGFSRILHSTTRSNCLLLTAFTEVTPDGSLVTPLMRHIAQSRRANRWNNTQENIYCLNAMRDYARIYENVAPDFTVSGTFGEYELGTIRFQGMDAEPSVLSYQYSDDDPGRTQQLKVKKVGKGRLYYTARLKLAYQEPRIDAVNAGMTVVRSYYKLDDGNWIALGDSADIKRGDLVRVQLKINIPIERLYVAVNDPLPAGLEPINTALATASLADAAGESNDSAGSYYWNEDDYWYGAYRTGGFYHRDLRLQSVQYFADFISPGDYELNYMTQAIATGKFSAGPTVIEEMYNPETYGKGAPARFAIGEQ